MEQENADVIIIGGGLVGSLCACFMARRGFKVTLYENREDLRKAKFSRGRSINLSLSHRGREALKAVGLEERVLKSGVPMKGRFVHMPNGKCKSIVYDSRSNQCIYSVSRNYLNTILLDEAESYPNVELRFNYKLIDADLRKNRITLMRADGDEIVETQAKLVIGADGAFSMVRRVMQQTSHFQYSQTYIEHGYLEFLLPAERGGALVGNHLHIWPRGDFMLISLPNKNGSWTFTLFMPFKRFDALQHDEDVSAFFRATFPDAFKLLGEAHLLEVFSKTRPSPLVSIKCNPYHFGRGFLIIGDAAHAMVPFYGQGMNAGFQDCTLLDNLLGVFGNDFGFALARFTEMRTRDAHEICDLAMYNYVEMRYLVTRPTYHARKALDDLLYRIFPGVWVPLYNSVTFTSLGYAFCVRNREWQDKIVRFVLASAVLLTSVLFLFFVFGLFY